MAEHYSKSTVSASAYCKPCSTFTQHDVYDGRLGSCQTCIKKREDEAKLPNRPEPARQESLF